MGIEPMTNSLLDQRSTDWAMRPYDKDEVFLFSKVFPHKKQRTKISESKFRSWDL